MSDSDVVIYGDRVRQARVLRRLNSADVAGWMKWAPATQTRLERAESKELAGDSAEALARNLRVSVNFLRSAPSAPLDEGDLRFRAAKTTTKNEKNFLVEFARTISEVIEWLERIHSFPPVKIPRLAHDSDTAKAAFAIRSALGYGSDQPIGHLTHKVERLGVVVVVRTAIASELERWDRGDSSIEKPSRSGRHFGYSVWSGEYRDRPMIVLRAIESWERTRWTIAHEIAHLVLHHAFLPADAEETASDLASELLAPIEEIRKELTAHVTLAELVPVKAKWGISLGALITHLRRTESVTSERADALAKQLYTRINPSTGRTWGLDEPGALDREVERPRLLSRWAERCLGTSSAPAVSEMMDVLPPDVIDAMMFAQRRSLARAGDQSRQRAATESTSGSVVSLADRRQTRRSARPERAAD